VRLEFRARARSDLARIYAFNIERSKQWAERVEQCLLDWSEALTLTPRIGRVTEEPGVRRLSVPDIQYVIDYRIVDDCIRVLQIYSTREIR
jgi:plasmid stabilization system protein ParE